MTLFASTSVALQRTAQQSSSVDLSKITLQWSDRIQAQESEKTAAANNFGEVKRLLSQLDKDHLDALAPVQVFIVAPGIESIGGYHSARSAFINNKTGAPSRGLAFTRETVANAGKFLAEAAFQSQHLSDPIRKDQFLLNDQIVSPIWNGTSAHLIGLREKIRGEIKLASSDPIKSKKLNADFDVVHQAVLYSMSKMEQSAPR